jgi:hypothetical protein
MQIDEKFDEYKGRGFHRIMCEFMRKTYFYFRFILSSTGVKKYRINVYNISFRLSFKNILKLITIESNEAKGENKTIQVLPDQFWVFDSKMLDKHKFLRDLRNKSFRVDEITSISKFYEDVSIADTDYNQFIKESQKVKWSPDKKTAWSTLIIDNLPVVIVDSSDKLYYVDSNISEGKEPFVVKIPWVYNNEKVEMIQEGEYTVILTYDFEITNSFWKSSWSDNK